MAAREMGGLSLADAFALCERFIDERLPPLSEVALAALALAELRHGRRAVGVDALKRIVRRLNAGKSLRS